MNYMDFKKKVLSDETFAAKFADCKTPEDLVAAAAKEGYTFTVEDIKNNTELLPEELENAAGGWGIASKHWFAGGHGIITDA